MFRLDVYIPYKHCRINGLGLPTSSVVTGMRDPERGEGLHIFTTVFLRCKPPSQNVIIVITNNGRQNRGIYSAGVLLNPVSLDQRFRQ